MTAPSTAGADTDIVVTDTTRNQGTGSSLPSNTGFYLSTNTDLWMPRTSGLAAGRWPRSAPASPISACRPPCTSRRQRLPGSYYVLAKADWDGVVTESIETNNVQSERRHQDWPGPDRLRASRRRRPPSPAARSTCRIPRRTRAAAARPLRRRASTCRRIRLSTRRIRSSAAAPFRSLLRELRPASPQR